MNNTIYDGAFQNINTWLEYYQPGSIFIDVSE